MSLHDPDHHNKLNTDWYISNKIGENHYRVTLGKNFPKMTDEEKESGKLYLEILKDLYGDINDLKPI